MACHTCKNNHIKTTCMRVCNVNLHSMNRHGKQVTGKRLSKPVRRILTSKRYNKKGAQGHNDLSYLNGRVVEKRAQSHKYQIQTAEHTYNEYRLIVIAAHKTDVIMVKSRFYEVQQERNTSLA